MEKVICSVRDKCKHSNTCGGAKPHDFDRNECNKCPMNLAAICVGVKELDR